MDLQSLIPKDAQAFKTKTIDKLMECTNGEHSLRKVLSPLDLTLMGIGAIIGTGIFVITGVVAANYSGPALVVSFVIAGIVCAFAALAYAEFASMVPVSGSAYTYSYASLGEIWAWIIGWDLILEYGVSIAAVAVGWSGYATSLIAGAGITLPAAFINPPGTNGGLVNLPAMAIILLVSVILIIGVRESARVNMVIVAIKLAVIFLFLYLAFGHIRPANWVPFMPFGWNGVI
ncbi:MAG: amino acid permease, partial [Methanoregula sp.]